MFLREGTEERGKGSDRDRPGEKKQGKKGSFRLFAKREEMYSRGGVRKGRALFPKGREGEKKKAASQIA